MGQAMPKREGNSRWRFWIHGDGFPSQCKASYTERQTKCFADQPRYGCDISAFDPPSLDEVPRRAQDSTAQSSKPKTNHACGTTGHEGSVELPHGAKRGCRMGQHSALYAPQTASDMSRATCPKTMTVGNGERDANDLATISVS